MGSEVQRSCDKRPRRQMDRLPRPPTQAEEKDGDSELGRGAAGAVAPRRAPGSLLSLGTGGTGREAEDTGEHRESETLARQMRRQSSLRLGPVTCPAWGS